MNQDDKERLNQERNQTIDDVLAILDAFQEDIAEELLDELLWLIKSLRRNNV